MGESVFGDFDSAFENTEPAQPFSSDRIPPGVYKMMCVAVDKANDGVLKDLEIIDNRTANKASGVKIFCEVIEPAKMTVKVNGKETEVDTKGKIIEHVFWVTEKNLPYVKRDLQTILGRPVTKISEVEKIAWAGRTFEAGVKDEPYNGWVNSRIGFINEWKPEATPAATAQQPAGQKPTANAGQKGPLKF